MSFETSLETDKLDAVLAKAQGEIDLAITDKFNPAFKYKYADLASIWEACRQPLTKYGINVTQWPIHSDNGRCILLTRIAHGGQWMKATWSVPVTKQDAQGYGSALTYLKRYSLSAVLGISKGEGEADDDGNAASGLVISPKTVDDVDPNKWLFYTISNVAQQLGYDKETMKQISKERYKVENAVDLDREQLNDLIKFLQKKIAGEPS